MKIKLFFTLLISILSSLEAFSQWQTIHYPFASDTLPWLNAVEFSDANHGISVGTNFLYDEGLIISTNNGGSNWDTTHNLIDVVYEDVTYVNGHILIAIGYELQSMERGIISKSTDSGKTWTDSYVPNRLISVYFLNDSVGFCTGDNGSIYKTVDTGNSWIYNNLGLSNYITSVSFINESIGFASSMDTIAKTLDGGINWSYTSMSDTNQIYSLDNIQFTSDSIGYCNTSHDLTLLKTVDQGQTWILSTPNNNGLFYQGMFFTDDSTGYIVGQFSVIKTVDGGLNWVSQQSSPPAGHNFFDDLTDVFFLNQDTGYIVGGNQFYKTYNAGEIVTSIESIEETNSNILIYPNPAKENINILLNQSEAESYTMQIVDLIGNVVLEEVVGPSTRTTTDVSELSGGIYFVTLLSGNNKAHSQKLIIAP